MTEHGPARGRLPAEPNALVGRARELAQVSASLAVSRLVTLTGVGGVGKSRVALRAARNARSRHPDGVWLVELGALRHAALLPHTVAAVLGMADQTVRPQIEVLAEYLADRRALLVLDGCEHLRSSVAELVQALLAAAPGLVVLATGRQALGLPGERRITVPPLPVPDLRDPPGGPRSRTLRNEAVTLFLARAADAVPGFALGDGEEETVARLCRSLDGIPLALELAAVRLRSMTAAEILAGMEDRFALLGSGHAALPRHQTLRTAIGWSHELCTPGERLLWARLSVFAGGLDLDAAEAVCTDDRLPPAEAPGLLAGLVDKSILLPCSDEGRVRFRLLDTVREYGAGWLASLGEERVLRRRHRDHYKDLALRCENEWYGPGQLAWYRRLTSEHANLRAALDHCLSDPAETRAGLETAAALWPFWIASGFMREGRRYVERALERTVPDDPARAKAQWVCSYLAIGQGDLTGAAAHAEQAGLLAIRTGARRHLACAVQFNAMALTLGGEAERGGEAMVVAQELHGTPPGADPLPVMAMGMRAFALNARGAPDQAAEMAWRARALCHENGELWWRSYMDWLLSMIWWGTGDGARAARSARAALEAKARFRDLLGIALCLETLAAVAARSDAVRAARLHGAVERVWRMTGTARLGAPQFIELHDRAERTARAVLGDMTYDRAAGEGDGWELPEAIAYAMAERRVRSGAGG
ncbi:ATP-binding protein [Spirillospora sp. NPDC127200]